MAHIGIDLVDIRAIRKSLDQGSGAFLRHTFTPAEQQAAQKAPDMAEAEYLAARFAVKEAAFKAIAHFTKAKTFDFRMIETLNEPDGYPVITLTEPLKALMEEAGVQSLSVSISTETDYAIAIVLAE